VFNFRKVLVQKITNTKFHRNPPGDSRR